jgi:Spy/CpxP family protein refolding chaperone
MQLRRGLAVIALGICCAWPAFSQEGAKTRPAIAQVQKAKPATGAKKYKPRLPNYYGKLDLTDQQREKIYSLQAIANGEIEALEEKINAIKEKRDGDIEAVLSPEQKAKLVSLQGDAKKKRDSKKSPKPPVQDEPAENEDQ